MGGSIKTETEVEATPESVAAFIIKRAKEIWEEKQSPLMLSQISPELQLRNVNYKDVLPAGTTLRQFVATLDKDLRIVSHPVHKSKIAVVPNETTFVFEAEPTARPATAANERPKKARRPNQRFIVMQFLSALSRLSEDEQKSVSIPVHILARLMEEK
jgi:hypothetical protein